MATLKVPVSPDEHIQGAENAAVTLVEYGDYQCPFCGSAYPIVKKLQKKFGDQLRFIFRNFPLAQIHPFAEPAAETAEYAGAKGQFWEMHDRLYENQSRLDGPLFFELAQVLGTARRRATRSPREARVPSDDPAGFYGRRASRASTGRQASSSTVFATKVVLDMKI